MIGAKEAILVDSRGVARTGEDAEARKAAGKRLKATVMAYLDQRDGRPLLNGVRAPEHLNAVDQAVYFAQRGIDPFALPVDFICDEDEERPSPPRREQKEADPDDARFEAALRQVAETYAWIAGQEGLILRKAPLEPALRDRAFDRLSKVKYGFKDSSGKLQFPRMQDVLSRTLDDKLDFGFIVAETVEFQPSAGETFTTRAGALALNLRRPSTMAMRGDPKEPRAFLEHVSYLLNGDQTAIDHVLSFLAHLAQRPGERVDHALLITSAAKGVGKSTLGQIVRTLVGETDAGVAQSKDLKSQFDGWIAGKLVVQVDEVYEAGNWDLANKLKPLITEPTVSVNIKYGPQKEVQNFARFLMFSNHSAPPSIEEGDRRYFVINSKATARDPSYYQRLHREALSDNGIEAIYVWLMKRDICGWNPHAPPPMTDAKREIEDVSGNPLFAYVADLVESGKLYGALGREFGFAALQDMLQKSNFAAHARNNKEVGEAMKAAGIESVRARTGHRSWRFPGTMIAEQEAKAKAGGASDF